MHRRLIASILAALLSCGIVQAWAEGIAWDIEAYDRFSTAMFSSGREPIVYTEDHAPVYVLTRFVVEGNSAEDWVEAFEVMNTQRRNEPRNVRKWYERFQAQGEANCPGNWSVLDKSRSSITFERRTSECPPHAAQHALYRVLYGPTQVFVLIATRKGSMDDAMRTGWLGVLESARVE